MRNCAACEDELWANQSRILLGYYRTERAAMMTAWVVNKRAEHWSCSLATVIQYTIINIYLLSVNCSNVTAVTTPVTW